MPKNFKFSAKISIVGIILIICMLRLSYWQWERHLEKNVYLKVLGSRLVEPIENLNQVLDRAIVNPDDFLNRRFTFSGKYDFQHEFIIKNRRLNKDPGVLVITPLQLTNSNAYVLISRGFIPLKKSKLPARRQYQVQSDSEITALFKTTNPRKFLAPKDKDTSNDLPWIDEFLRIDIEHIQKQFPYKLAPFYLEVLPYTEDTINIAEIVKSDSNKEELLMLPLRGLKAESSKSITTAYSESDYPVPVLSTVLPSARHLGYVFEWAVMAVMTGLVCMVLQFRR